MRRDMPVLQKLLQNWQPSFPVDGYGHGWQIDSFAMIGVGGGTSVDFRPNGQLIPAGLFDLKVVPEIKRTERRLIAQERAFIFAMPVLGQEGMRRFRQIVSGWIGRQSADGRFGHGDLMTGGIGQFHGATKQVRGPEIFADFRRHHGWCEWGACFGRDNIAVLVQIDSFHDLVRSDAVGIWQSEMDGKRQTMSLAGIMGKRREV